MHDAEATIAGTETANTSNPTRPPDEWGPGDKIGRYAVLERLGAGTMGVVVAAYDPALDRRVAIKLIRGGPPSAASSLPEQADMRRRMREAQTLAKLSHPNVVAVHDVGELRDNRDDTTVFIAMEFVSGKTLRQWLQTPRSTEEIVAAFVQAGRGLAAAHAAGITHRDFKPDNVMIGDEGRVRVMDFGLARAQTSPSHASDPRTSMHRFSTAPGTPAYMAPEQHLEHPVGPAADQFAFCVALHEALVGARPFPGESPAEIAYSVTHDVPAAPPRSLPENVRVVLTRGLARKPAERFETMDALLHVLGGDVRRARVRWFAGGVVIAAVVGLLALLPLRDQTCERLGAAMTDVWSPARREAVVDRISEQLTRDIATRAAADLDRFASTWRVQRTAACTDGQTESVDADLAERRVACLEGARHEFAAIVDALERDEGGHLRPFEVLELLPKLGQCADGGSLRLSAPLPADAEQRAGITRVRGILAGVGALEVSGRYVDAARELASAEAEAPALGYPALDAELSFARGRLLVGQGHWSDAIAALTEAVWTALRARHSTIAIRAAMRLAFVESDHRQAPADAEVWLDLAESLLVAADAPDDPMWGELWQVRGLTLFRADRFEEAMVASERALEIGRTVQDSRTVAMALQTLAFIHRREARYARSNESVREGIEVLRVGYGDGHPMIGSFFAVRGANFVELGDLDSAMTELTAALEHYEVMLPATHFKVLEGRWSLCLVHQYAARHDVAERCLRDLLAVASEDEAIVDRWRWDIVPQLQITLLRKGDVEGARELATQGEVVASHPLWAASALAQIDLAAGRAADARARLEDAVRSAPAEVGSIESFWAHYALARTALVQGDVARAAEVLTSLEQDDEAMLPQQERFLRALAGRVAAAREDFERSIGVLEISTRDLLASGATMNWPETAEALVVLAQALTARERRDEALTPLRRAIAIYERLPGYARDREAAKAELARLEGTDARPHD